MLNNIMGLQSGKSEIKGKSIEQFLQQTYCLKKKKGDKMLYTLKNLRSNSTKCSVWIFIGSLC